MEDKDKTALQSFLPFGIALVVAILLTTLLASSFGKLLIAFICGAVGMFFTMMVHNTRR